MPHTVTLGTFLGTVCAVSCRSDEPRRRTPPPLRADGLARAFLPLRRLGGGRWLSGSAVAAAAVPRGARTRTFFLLPPPPPPGEAGPPPALGGGGSGDRPRDLELGGGEACGGPGAARGAGPPAAPGRGVACGVTCLGDGPPRPSPRRCRGRLEACVARAPRLSLSGEPPCAAGAGGRHRLGRWVVPAGLGSRSEGISCLPAASTLQPFPQHC